MLKHSVKPTQFTLDYKGGCQNGLKNFLLPFINSFLTFKTLRYLAGIERKIKI